LPLEPIERLADPSEISLSLAATQRELEEAFRLLYQSYEQAGLVLQNARGVHLTSAHAVSGTEVFIAQLRNEVISTLTMVPDVSSKLPMDTMYARELDGLREEGVRLAEIGSFADRRSSPSRFLSLFVELAKYVIETALRRKIDTLVVATHPRHSRFYQRLLGFKPFGDLQSCPYAQSHPAVAMRLDLHADMTLPASKGNLPIRRSAISAEPTIRDGATRTFLESLLDATPHATRDREPGLGIPLFGASDTVPTTTTVNQGS
jgi:hypothetical protein